MRRTTIETVIEIHHVMSRLPVGVYGDGEEEKEAGWHTW